MPITVKQAVNSIHANGFLLPSIQRELVWDEERIERLFDSLMRDYPIGSFLFWRVPAERVNDFQFYEFMRRYHERDFKHNAKANVVGISDITAVLDGQQRLSALYIGLRGTYARKIRWKRRNDPQAYPKKELYLNIESPLSEEGQEELDMRYEFRFLIDSEANSHTGQKFWFKVGDILTFSEQNPAEINNYLVDSGLGNNKFAGQCLFKLNQVIQESPVIAYFEEQDSSIDKVLDIFVRINSGGVPLNHSDLLLSIATSQWETLDAREEIYTLVDDLNRVRDGFSFSKDFVLKAALVLSDLDVKFKVGNFNRKNTRVIESQWDEIASALRLTVDLVASFGFSLQNLTSNNALIPIAYYLKKVGASAPFLINPRHSDDRASIRRWLLIALIKQIFSGQSDTVLNSIRNTLKTDGLSQFPADEIQTNLSASKSMRVTEEEVDGLLDTTYGGRQTFLVLSLLYPTLDYRNIFHQDHIFPKSFFASPAKLSRAGVQLADHDKYLGWYNCLGNLQLLEGAENQQKRNQHFEEWLDSAFTKTEERDGFKRRNFIPNVDLSFTNFVEFFEKREERLVDELKTVLL